MSLFRYRFPNAGDLKDWRLQRLVGNWTRMPLTHALALDGYAPLLAKGELSTGTVAMVSAEAYLADRHAQCQPWLVLTGTSGQGKSLAACWVLLQEYAAQLQARNQASSAAVDPASQPGPTGKFITGTDLTRAEPWGDEVEQWSNLGSTLVLDDLAAGYDGKGSYAGKVEDVLLARYNGLRPTVVTSNQRYQEFAERFPRVVSRAKQVGRIFECLGPSLREAR